MAERSGLSQRVRGVAPSATVAITEKAKALRARGEKVIGFGAGEPDFPTPEHIVEAGVAAVRDPGNHRYSATAGLPDLRDAIVRKTRRDSGYDVSPGQVLVTNGGKAALYEVCQTLLDPGDAVLLPAPYWVTYPEVIKLAGATPVVLPAGLQREFRVGVADLEQARTERTRLLIFTSPSNPTGGVYPEDEVAAIGRWAAEHGIWVITDEIYEHLVYDGATAPSLPALVPEVAAHCIVINAVSKTYAMTGWRVGWAIGPEAFIKGAVRLQTHLSTNVANVAQRAAVAALDGGLDDVVRMREAFDRRRLTMHRMLGDIPGVEPVLPRGAFYAFPSVAGLLGRPIGERAAATSLELADLLLDEAQVAVVPGEAFGAPGYVRLSFALADADLEEGLSRVHDLVVDNG